MSIHSSEVPTISPAAPPVVPGPEIISNQQTNTMKSETSIQLTDQRGGNTDIEDDETDSDASNDEEWNEPQQDSDNESDSDASHHALTSLSRKHRRRLQNNKNEGIPRVSIDLQSQHLNSNQMNQQSHETTAYLQSFNPLLVNGEVSQSFLPLTCLRSYVRS